MTLKKKALDWKTLREKGDNADNQHFLLFPTVFSTQSKGEIVILATFNLLSANAFHLVNTKNSIFLYTVNQRTQSTDKSVCETSVDWLIEWCFTPLLTVFQSYHSDSSHYSCFPGFTSTRLGSEVSCPRTLPRKNPEMWNISALWYDVMKNEYVTHHAKKGPYGNCEKYRNFSLLADFLCIKW